MIAEERIQDVAQRFDELTDELGIPELLSLSNELADVVDQIARIRKNARDAEQQAERYYQMMRDPNEARRFMDREAYERRMREEQRYARTYAYSGPVMNTPSNVIV